MGAGNPIIRSWDEQLFSPTTYFIDLTKDLDEEDDEHFVFDNFLDDLEFVLEEFNLEYPDKRSKDFYIDELSGEFRGSAVVLAKSKHTLLLTTTDSENHHLAIGCVPIFAMENCQEEADDTIDVDWYDRRDRLDLYEKKREQYANKEWNRQFKIFHKEATKILTELHKTYQFSERNGPWMSSKVETNKIINP